MIKHVVPNQKVITIRKAPCDKKNPYGVINRDAVERASHELKQSGLLLWMYLSLNQNGYEFALSNADVKAVWNMGRTQYNNAVNDLKEKGYLVNTEGNKWDFLEYPPVATTAENSYLAAKLQSKKK